MFICLNIEINSILYIHFIEILLINSMHIFIICCYPAEIYAILRKLLVEEYSI